MSVRIIYNPDFWEGIVTEAEAKAKGEHQSCSCTHLELTDEEYQEYQTAHRACIYLESRCHAILTAARERHKE